MPKESLGFPDGCHFGWQAWGLLAWGTPGTFSFPGELPGDTLGSVSVSRGVLLGWISSLRGALGIIFEYLFGLFPASERFRASRRSYFSENLFREPSILSSYV